MQDETLKAYLDEGFKSRKANKKMVQRLKKRTPKHLDGVVGEFHEEVFDKVDCLDCANCCKTTSPIFRTKDVERIASHFKMKAMDFINKYLVLDADEDYVLQTAPCTFLAEDNTCTIYDVRPMACREYPHTDRKRFYQLLDLSFKNTTVCPAVAKIFENMRQTGL